MNKMIFAAFLAAINTTSIAIADESATYFYKSSEKVLGGNGSKQVTLLDLSEVTSNRLASSRLPETPLFLVRICVETVKVHGNQPKRHVSFEANGSEHSPSNWVYEKAYLPVSGSVKTWNHCKLRGVRPGMKITAQLLAAPQGEWATVSAEMLR